jgi:hypothetical protein
VISNPARFVSKQVLSIFKADIRCSQSSSKRMTQVVYATLRESSTLSRFSPCTAIDPLDGIAFERKYKLIMFTSLSIYDGFGYRKTTLYGRYD